MGGLQDKSMLSLPPPESQGNDRAMTSNTYHDFGPMELLHMTKEELEMAWNPKDNLPNSNSNKEGKRTENMRTCLNTLDRQYQQ